MAAASLSLLPPFVVQRSGTLVYLLKASASAPAWPGPGPAALAGPPAAAPVTKFVANLGQLCVQLVAVFGTLGWPTMLI